MNIKSNKQYHPQMHSAEHILNQTMVRVFGCERSFSNHIEKKKSKCDYRFDRALTPEETSEIEKNVNAVVRSDLPVTETFLKKEAAEKTFDLNRLPEDADGRIRIVRIGEYDACPCIGPHVASTGEIGGFRITSASFENDVLRIRFKLSKD